ncbi:putative mitochondrion organization and biogenesis-related protein [Endogone sp. FLAS-F59071]|nr:putative mitochondrion organization and biogenesis-related protein [Endogone sp. FLAS-F59071]|eukprot:RUS20608.1 putative mitochondrion organization and biogenesis-related protein [Endogone sp. FLAS-F59071]
MDPTPSDQKHSSLLNAASKRAHAFSTSVPGTLPSQRIVRVNTPTVSATYLLTTHGHLPARYSTRANANYNPFANALPSELRILRSPEAAASKQSVKEAAIKEEKENMASRAANLAKEQAEKAAKQEAEATQTGATGTGATVAKPSATAAVPEAAAAVVKPKKPLMQRIKDEAVHYWQGTKLLGFELKISSKLLSKVLRGGKLTRREYRQLRRTVADMFRLVPFLIFLIVPFMELLLPVALVLFPNMLPSTFEDKFREDEKKRKMLKVRLEMAKFLQETIAETGIPGEDSAKTAKEFTDFFRKIRSSGEQATTEDILRIAKRFEDELTLDNLSRPQLVSMCRYMGINAFGTDNYLRYQIRSRMKNIKADDRMIAAEGVDSLTIPELQQACLSRGIRTIGVSPARLRDELVQWLDLHLNHQVPSSLLILSRAFSFSDRGLSTNEALQATLISLPDNLVSADWDNWAVPMAVCGVLDCLMLVNEAELQVMEAEGAVTYKQKLEVLEQQQELIEDEQEQEQEAKEAEEEARKEREEKDKADKLAKEAQKRDEFVSDVATATSNPATITEQEEVRLTEEQLQELRNALAILVSKAGVLEERETLNEIKEDHEDYKEVSFVLERDETQEISKSDIEELKEATKRTEGKASTHLGTRLEKMLKRLDKELDLMEKEHSGSTFPRINATEAGQITTADLEEALRVIRHAPDNSQIKRVVKQLDADNDGLVFLNHIVDLAEQVPEGLGVVIENVKEGQRDGSLKTESVKERKAELPIEKSK